MEAQKHQVIIVGGGPTGLMLAAELKLAGIDLVVIERRADQHIDGSRARGIHSRVVEVLDQRGVAERFIAEGRKHPSVGFAGARLDISDFPTRHNYLLGLMQSNFESILANWIDELGVTIVRGSEVTSVTQNEQEAIVETASGQVFHADYVVGCDGGRSFVRKSAGIDFPGLEPSVSYIIAEVQMTETPEFGVRPEGGGIGKGEDGSSIAITIREKTVKQGDKPTINELREALLATYNTDYGLSSINWISRFSDATRQAATYRKGRVLLAGDAAHIHPPQGGQGLGIGIQDAVNLGWKLGQVVNGVSHASLLDTYHTERHPVGARVLQNTRAQIVLSNPDPQHVALHEITNEIIVMDEPRKHIVGMLSGLDIHYNLGEGHPLLGRRIPDLDLQTKEGTVRIFTLLHSAKAVLINFDKSSSVNSVTWSDHVTYVEAKYEGEWDIPVIGKVAAPPAALIRPDGYVAWVGDITDPKLADAITTWLGTPVIES